MMDEELNHEEVPEEEEVEDAILDGEAESLDLLKKKELEEEEEEDTFEDEEEDEEEWEDEYSDGEAS